MLWLLVIMTIGLLVNCHFWFKHTDKLNKIADEKLAAEKLTYQKKLKLACQFPDGFAPTENGYWFDLKRYHNPIFGEPILADNTPYDMDRYQLDGIGYQLDNKGKCYVQGFYISMMWNGKELKRNPKHENKNLVPDGWESIFLETCTRKECEETVVRQRNNGMWKKVNDTYIKNGIRSDGYGGKCQLSDSLQVDLENYPNLMIQISSCETKYNVFDKWPFLVVKNYKSLLGYPYSFECIGFYPQEKEKINDTAWVKKYRVNGHHDCFRQRLSQPFPIFFDGGSVTPSNFSTDVLPVIIPFMRAIQHYPSQLITKEKPQ